MAISALAFYGLGGPQDPFGWQRISEIERSLRISFSNKSLLKTALTHKSYLNEPGGEGLECNERLEFLGDAALGLAIAEELYAEACDSSCGADCDCDCELTEGEMTLIRSKVVDTKTLAAAARELNLGEYLLMGKGEERSGGRSKHRNLAGAFEAVVGAIFLDKGYGRKSRDNRHIILPSITGQHQSAREFCVSALEGAIVAAHDEVFAASPKPPKPKKSKPAAANKTPSAAKKTPNANAKNANSNKSAPKAAKGAAAKPAQAKKKSSATQSANGKKAPNTAGKHPKTALQELTQAKRGVTPEYRIVKQSGKSNAMTFVVRAYVSGKLMGEGSGASKKAAETKAAEAALKAFR